jgi:hypothetical protein
MYSKVKYNKVIETWTLIPTKMRSNRLIRKTRTKKIAPRVLIMSSKIKRREYEQNGEGDVANPFDTEDRIKRKLSNEVSDSKNENRPYKVASNQPNEHPDFHNQNFRDNKNSFGTRYLFVI